MGDSIPGRVYRPGENPRYCFSSEGEIICWSAFSAHGGKSNPSVFSVRNTTCMRGEIKDMLQHWYWKGLTLLCLFFLAIYEKSPFGSCRILFVFLWNLKKPKKPKTIKCSLFAVVCNFRTPNQTDESCFIRSHLAVLEKWFQIRASSA